MLQVSMDFDLPLKQLKTRGTKVSQLYHFNGISLQLFTFLDSFIDFAAISISKHLI